MHHWTQHPDDRFRRYTPDVSDTDDPISAADAEVIAAVVDHIDPDSPLIDEQLYYILEAELDAPPTMDEIQAVLAILRMPHLRYQPGESSAAVLGRMRAMLGRA